jgi:4,5-dihydroxyphthalate decarboxylase
MSTLSAGLLFSDRIEAFLDGRVTIPGYDLAISCRPAQALFRSVLRDAAFDVAELSLCSHIAAVSAGRNSYVGLPIFPSRAFRHGNLYVRTDRVRRPQDLVGKRIGLIDYQQTAAMWLRGILADDYGVTRESVTWVTGGLHAPELTDRVPGNPRPEITVYRSDKALDILLREGEIDAIISPVTPECHHDRAVPVDRMWPDFAQVQHAWWKRRRLFPIMHILVVRRTLVEADPSLAAALCTAFDSALGIARHDLMQRDFPKLVLANQFAAAKASKAEFGSDLWVAGLVENKAVLEKALTNARADGLTNGAFSVSDLFVS